jgi:electron transport complex protein RnfG
VNAQTGQNIVWNTKVLSQAETPGLGAKCVEPAFASQFKELDPAAKKLYVKKDGGDIDAITASTITSRAYVSGVATAVNVLATIQGTPMLIDTASGASSAETDNE